MRMIVATILALAPLPAAATPTRPADANNASAPAKCDPFGHVDQAVVLRRSGPPAQRLDQLPPGDLHLAVERQINGCHQPVIVRENIGGAAFRPR